MGVLPAPPPVLPLSSPSPALIFLIFGHDDEDAQVFLSAWTPRRRLKNHAIQNQHGLRYIVLDSLSNWIKPEIFMTSATNLIQTEVFLCLAASFLRCNPT
jgi:hypothetical protein